jgi:hypothetical protein
MYLLICHDRAVAVLGNRPSHRRSEFACCRVRCKPDIWPAVHAQAVIELSLANYEDPVWGAFVRFVGPEGLIRA